MAQSTLPTPRVMDLHGQLRDPHTGNPLNEGQEGPGSIFHVPSAGPTTPDYRMFTGPDKSIPFSEYMETLRKAGFQGSDIFLHVTPRPQDIDRVPSPPPPERETGPDDSGFETSIGRLYRTNCNYCWAIVQGKERERGFTLREIDQAAKNGCSTCGVLRTGITKFADLIFPHYDFGKVRVRQKENGVSKLLSETNNVRITFDEFGGETILLKFGGSVNFRSNQENRIMETSSYASILLIKDWFRTCSEEHDECAIPAASTLPTRVLDISNFKVKLLETHGMVAPYITLSHCWGRKPIIRLLQTNIEDFQKDIPWTCLSRTFQDAIMVAWKLGFRFIWIDALCILQDSVPDWEFHASKMAPIFSNSQLTLSASSGSDGSKGLFSSREKEPYTLHRFESRMISNPVLWMPHKIEGKDREDCLKTFTVRLKTPHGLYQDRKPKEPLLKRAWVFQEQILCPRNVHFASGELYFECKSHDACECSGWSSRSSSYQWETRWRKAHTFLLGLHPSLAAQVGNKNGDFEAYCALIETFTQLDITNELDRLPALSGITSGRQDEYLAGMWRSLLIESLHWYPVSEPVRGSVARRTVQYRAPTWSWASVEAPIRHIELTLNTSIHATKFVSKIVAASVTPVGLDPRGRVSEGYLRIQGPMGGALVTVIGECEREGSAAEETMKKIAAVSPDKIDRGLSPQYSSPNVCTYAMLRREGKEGICYLDIHGDTGCTNPAEVSVGDEVTLLVISTAMVMVLKSVLDAPGCYTRVGIFKPKDEGWSFPHARESIFII